MGRSGGRETIKSSPKDKGKLDDLGLFLGVEIPQSASLHKHYHTGMLLALPKVKFHIKSTLQFTTLDHNWLKLDYIFEVP